MKNVDCEVIKDLLPLYVDDCCSEKSRHMVEEHLSQCEKCKHYKSLISVEMKAEDEVEGEKEPEIRVIKKGIRKIKLAKILCIAFLAIAILTVFVIIPVRNYMAGEGVTYDNLDEIKLVNKFFSSLEKGEYEDAFKYVDVEYSYNELLEINDNETDADIEAIKNYGYDWYKAAAFEYFSESMKKMAEEGISIQKYDIVSITEDYKFDVKVTFENKETCMVEVHVKDGKINPYISRTSFDVKFERILEIYFLRFVSGRDVLQALYEDSDFDWELLFEEDLSLLD